MFSSPIFLSVRNKIESTSVNPKFGGVTHNLAGQRWLSTDIFQKLINESPTPYIGKLPPAFINSSQANSPKEFYQAFDELAQLLSVPEGTFQNKLQLAAIEEELQGYGFEFYIGKAAQPIELQYILNIRQVAK